MLALRLSPFTTAALPLSPLLLALLGAVAHASDKPTAPAVETLSPIQVSAQTGSDTNIVLRARRMELEQARDLQDLFKHTPEVSVGGGSLGITQKIYVHGLSERMLSISLDGAAQNESPFHHSAQILLEPDLLQKVEVEAGTAAANAGPGALAGALRFTTKSARDLLRKDEKAGALLKYGYQSADHGSKLSLQGFARVSDSVGVLAAVSRLHGSDYRAGDGSRVPNSAAHTENNFLKLDWREGQQKLLFSLENVADEGWRNQRSNLLPAAFNPAQQQKMTRESANFAWDYAQGKLLNLHLAIFTNRNQVELARNTPKHEKFGSRSQGLNISNLSRLAEHKLEYGFNYRHETGYADKQADESASVAGLFMQDSLALGEQWLASAGLRYDRYQYSDMIGRKFSKDGFSPSFSLSFLPQENLSLRLSHARALRGVGLLEPYLKQYQTNDPSLEAEKAHNTSLALQWQQGAWQVAAGVFAQNISNYIGYDDKRMNLGDVRSKGYNASLAYTGTDWSASLGMAHAKPELGGNPLSSSDAFLLGNASGRTWLAQFDKRWQAHSFGWSMRLQEKLSFVPSGSKEKPGYALHDVYWQWQVKPDLRLAVNVKNLFDKNYVDQSSFGYHPRWGKVAALPEAGRDIRVSLAWRI